MSCRRIRRLSFIAIALISLSWSLLYLPHLRNSPKWYGDETLTLIIGKALFAGHPSDRAMKISFWHPSYSYQPGYAWMVGGIAWLFNGDILGARLLNAFLALAIGLTIYVGGRGILGHFPAWFGALMFLGYSQSVIHFRWIYPHNAVAFGLLITLLAILRRSRPKVDWMAGAGLGIAAMSHPLFIHGMIAALLSRIKQPRSWFRLATPPTIVIFLSLVCALFRYWPEHWLFQDLSDLFEFYLASSSQSGSGIKAVENIRVFYCYDFFHIGAAVGGFLCLRRRLYPIAIFVFVISALLLQNRQNIPIFYYQAVTFLPALSLAWSGGFRVLLSWLRRFGRGSTTVSRSAATIGLILAMLSIGRAVPESLSGHLISRNDFWVTQIPEEVEHASRWLNERVAQSDLVICNPNIAWLLHCRVADLMQATAWRGKRTFTFERPVSRERFLFPADVNEARYVVVGDIDQRWTFLQPGVADIAYQLADEKWPVVWQGRFYLILENPNLKAN
jgi:hypothetical protein